MRLRRRNRAEGVNDTDEFDVCEVIAGTIARTEEPTRGDHDDAICVLIALDMAGFRVVRK